jgi:hypothetical protein
MKRFAIIGCLLALAWASPTPMQVSLSVDTQTITSLQDICFLICLPESPQCPNGWYASQKGDCWTCCRSPTDDVTSQKEVVTVEEHAFSNKNSVSDVSISINVNTATSSAKQNICLLICLPEAPQCPDGWSANQKGDCWTCCKNPDDDLALHVKPSTKEIVTVADVKKSVEDGQLLNTNTDICLRVCWPETPTCPDGWYSNNLGIADQPCWTCCKSPSLKSSETEKKIIETSIKLHEFSKNNQNICFKVCWPETPTCPDGWFSNNFGTADQPCWTCCKSPDNIAVSKPKTLDSKKKVTTTDVAVKISEHEALAQNQNICLKVCWPEISTCPDGWFSNNFGTQQNPCWTCCKSPDSSLVSSEKHSPKLGL